MASHRRRGKGHLTGFQLHDPFADQMLNCTHRGFHRLLTVQNCIIPVDPLIGGLQRGFAIQQFNERNQPWIGFHRELLRQVMTPLTGPA